MFVRDYRPSGNNSSGSFFPDLLRKCPMPSGQLTFHKPLCRAFFWQTGPAFLRLRSIWAQTFPRQSLAGRKGSGDLKQKMQEVIQVKDEVSYQKICIFFLHYCCFLTEKGQVWKRVRGS